MHRGRNARLFQPAQRGAVVAAESDAALLLDQPPEERRDVGAAEGEGALGGVVDGVVADGRDGERVAPADHEEYERDLRRRLGESASQPKRIRYKPLQR